MCCLSLNERELCPLHPSALIIPCSASMLFLCIVAGSCASSPVSARIVKIVAYFRGEAEIFLLMFSVVGISGIFRSVLYLGFSHWMSFFYRTIDNQRLVLFWLRCILTRWLCRFLLLQGLRGLRVG